MSASLERRPLAKGLAAEDLDLVVHLGDYIYEYDPSSRFADRRHTTPRTPGLDTSATSTGRAAATCAAW